MTRFAHKKILVIDDDPELGLVYKALLEREAIGRSVLRRRGIRGW